MDSKSILLVEDDELDVISFQRSLNRLNLNHRFYTAYNGIEALAMLRGDGVSRIEPLPDVVVLDVNMPRMNGIEFLKELRNDPDPALSGLKVFIMTTSHEDYDRHMTEQLGVSGYLIKPLNFNDNNKRVSSLDNFMQFHILKILGQ